MYEDNITEHVDVVADRGEGAYTFDSSQSDTLEGELMDDIGLSAEQAEQVADRIRKVRGQFNIQAGADALGLLLRLVLRPGNVRSRLVSFAFAAGVDVGYKTMTQAANDFGLTRAAISKEARLFQRALKLPKNRHTRIPAIQEIERRRLVNVEQVPRGKESIRKSLGPRA